MSITKKGKLVLIPAALVIVFTVLALVFGMGAASVKADNEAVDNAVASVTDADTLNAIHTNGRVEETYDPVVLYYNQDSTPLTSVSEIQAFLTTGMPIKKASKNSDGEFIKDASGKNYVFEEAQSGTTAKIGYLINNVSGYSWGGAFTNEFMAAGRIFDGAGKTVELNPTAFNSSPWVNMENFPHKLSNTYFTTVTAHTDADLNGGFIGFIPDSSVIKNTKFRYISKIEDASNRQVTSGSGCGGVVAAYSNGKIDNCSVTIAQGSTLKVYKGSALRTSGIGGDSNLLSISRHSYALGGFVGAMSRNTAAISNSEIKLESSSELYVQADGEYKTNVAGIDYSLKGHVRAFVGGVVGWMANGSNVYNICVSGSGNINGYVSGCDTGMALCGAVAGSNVITTLPNSVNSVAGNASSTGTIDGVITSWTGKSTYNMAGGDAMKQYSPWNTISTDGIQGQLVGITGTQDNATTAAINNIYCMSDIVNKDGLYAKTNNSFSIGYFYALTMNSEGSNTNRGSKMSTVVDVYYLTDDNSVESYASSDKVQLTWGGTDMGSDVFATYDIHTDDKYILWAKSVKRGENVAERETYFWRNDSQSDAQKYDVTYTPVYRGRGLRVKITYEFGRAVYMYKAFADGKEASGANLNREEIQYGNDLTIPEIRLFTMPGVSDKNDPSFVRAFTDHSYWKTIKNGSNSLNSAGGRKDVGDYETLIYLDNPADGTDYRSIHFLDERFRLVSYIKDDTNYQTYAQKYQDTTGEEYSYIDLNNKKAFDWQPRIKQTVVQKEIGVKINTPTDISFGGLYPNLSTTYSGNVIEFSAEPVGALKGDDVKVTLKYYNADDLDNDISGIYNAGNYVIKAVELSNDNYALMANIQNINLEVNKKSAIIEFAPGVKHKEENGEYHITLPYNGNAQELQYDKGFSLISEDEMKKRGLHFFVYGVRDVDKSIIQLEHIAFDDQTPFDNINVGKFRAIVDFQSGGAADNYNLPEINTFVIEIEPVAAKFEAWEKKVFYYGDDIPESEDRDGDYAYALSPTGERLAISEKTYAKYNMETGKYDLPLKDGESTPINVGKYLLTYTVSNANNKNFVKTVESFEVEILQRDVTFTPRVTQWPRIEYGKNDPQLGQGSFDRFYTNGADVNTGLTVTHYQNNRIEYRYQYIGLPQTEEDSDRPYTLINDMNTVYETLPDKLIDVGCYVIYPVLKLRNGNEYVYDADAMSNYKFTFIASIVNIYQLEVTIALNDVYKAYGADIPQFNGRANSTSARSWEYVSENHFYQADDINVEIKTSATKYSGVEDQYDITVAENGYSGIRPGVENNYDITVVKSKLIVTPLKVEVVTNIDAEEIVYGDALPGYSFTVLSDNNFYATDTMDAGVKYISTAETNSGVGRYEVSADFSENKAFGNYEITVLPNYFIIRAKNITITNIEIEGGNTPFIYDGEIHNPTANVIFDGAVFGDELDVSYDFYINDVIVNEPVNVGVYEARVSGIVDKATGEINRNYILVKAPGQEEFPTASITIDKREIEVQARNAYRVWHVAGSLAPIEGDFVSKPNGTYEYTILPSDQLHFTYIGANRFVERDNVTAKVAIDQFYDELKLHAGTVGLEFAGDNLDNYDITVRKGSLLVIDASLDQIGPFVRLVYGEGDNKVDYVEGGIVYSGANQYNKISIFTTTEAIRNMLIFRISTDAEGRNITDKVVNAGTYYMVITPNAANGSPFDGMLTVPFVVSPAKRVLTKDSFTSKIHYNKLVFSSDIEGLEYRVNGQAWISANKDNVFEYNQVAPMQNYQVIVRAKASEDGNYLESNEYTMYCTTGIDASIVVNRIKSLNTVDFSNISVYKALKAQIENVHADDKYLIDSRKVAQLDQSYAKLLSDASNVIAGAQKVASKAAGKSYSSATTAAALSLSFSGVGLGFVGAMFIVSKKKREENEEVKAGAVKVRRKNAVKTLVAIMVIVTVCAVVLAGCKNVSFAQEDLLKLASFEKDSNETSKDLKITVTSGGMTIYSYDNGNVVTNDDVTAPDFSLGADGVGFDFKLEYFKNISYLTSKSTATFTADVENVSEFLGIADATNAKVTVVGDAQNERLNSITVIYEVGSFKVTIISTMKY